MTETDTAEKVRAEATAEAFPAGTLVRLNASEYKNWEGRVLSVVTKGFVAYVEVALTQNASAKMLPEERNVLKRASSLEKIDAYSEPKSKAAAPAAEGSEDAPAAE